MRCYAVALAALFLSPFAVSAGDGDDLAGELPRIKPLEPAAALESFEIHPGFKLVPIATEPLVTDPVAMAYDADGRAYVVEMRGYPYPENQPSGNVTLLTDKDGDGVFDSRSIFVGGLSWPTGVVPYYGGVFIAVAPDILFAMDLNGDGVADVKRKFFTGFGTQNVQGLVNGLLWGTDGWIYGSSGSNGGEIRNLARPDAKPVTLRGRDFRFRPDGSEFQAISGGGQFGHCLDDWGHRFVCNNSNHIRQVVLPAEDVDRNPFYTPGAVLTDIAVEGGAGPVFRISPPEPWRVVRTRQRAADPDMVKRLAPTELFATGFFTSASGITIYRGSAYPPEYRGNAFVGDVGGNLVHRKTLAHDGPIFKATRADAGVEFLASRDNWFRPVNFANTPYGTLAVLDMYRETIEHPASIPEPIKRHLDLTSGKDRGRIYEIVPERFQRRARPRLSAAPTSELFRTLADPDAWWRETAQRILIERHETRSLPMLVKLAAERPTALGRAHALWTLDALGWLDVESLLAAMTDPDANVREVGARLAQRHLTGHPGVQNALMDLAGDRDAMVRFQTALSLGEARWLGAYEGLARIARRDPPDRWVEAAVLSSAAGRAETLIAALGEGKPPFFFDEPGGLAWLNALAFVVGAENAPGKVAALLAKFLKDTDYPDRARTVLLGVARGLRRSGGTLKGAVPDLASITPFFDRAEAVATGRGPARERLDAIALVGVGPSDRAVAVLPGLLDAKEPATIQLAALQALNALDEASVGPAIVGRWKSLSPAVRREAVEALFARRDRVAALIEGLRDRVVSPSDLDPSRRAALLQHPDPAIRERARTLLVNASPSDRTRVLAAMRPSLELKGDAGRGLAVFKSTCATCHVAAGIGIEIGPNLATVANRTPEDLLVHVLDPNREVAANYVNYSVATVDGRVATGLIADETASTITLKRAEAAVDVIPRDRIEQIASSGQSLMPEGLEKDRSPQDFADLIAFIKGLLSPGAGPSRR
jgi:putative membrane-bound dehydrogenase-like protein